MSETDVTDIRDAVLGILMRDWDGPFMVGDVVLLAEITDSDGDTNLFTLHNTEITVWKEVGMLRWRLESISSGDFELEDDDEQTH